MFYKVVIYFGKDLPGLAKGAPETFRVKADTPTAALVTVLAMAWTCAERDAFVAARVDKSDD